VSANLSRRSKPGSSSNATDEGPSRR
jgi:hypothetical protein